MHLRAISILKQEVCMPIEKSKYLWLLISVVLGLLLLFVFRAYTMSGESGEVPVITSISPNMGASFGGTLITLSGTGFLADAFVEIDGVECTSVRVPSSTTLICTTGANVPGSHTVTVTNGNGYSASLPDGYTHHCAPRSEERVALGWRPGSGNRADCFNLTPGR